MLQYPGVLETPASYIMFFVRKNFSDAAEEKQTLFKIHHIKESRGSYLKFWLVCANFMSFLSGLCTQIYSTLRISTLWCTTLKHLTCQTALKEE